jgi:peptidoglycan/xylan/chitin deacetylase (PgdA/CDA1 family)
MRRVVAVVAPLFVLLLLSFGALTHAPSSSIPGRIPSVSAVEAGSMPDPPEAPAPEPSDGGQLWAAAIAQDPWPDLATNGTTGTSGGRIVLTFDDGPDPRTTPPVLDALREHNVKATFFVVGSQVAKHPDLLRRIAEEGHAIGNHTYNHADMSELSPQRMRSELRATQQAVDGALGYHYPMVLMRPPYGNPYFEGSEALPAFREVVRGQGLIPVTWTVDPGDYRRGDHPGGIVRAVVRADEGGREGESDEVLLLHDNHGQTAQALPQIIDYYEGSGRTFAQVGELLADKYFRP